MKKIAANLTALTLAALTLAACGADGEPIPPTMSANVGLGTSGMSASTNVTMGRGPVSVGVGLGL